MKTNTAKSEQNRILCSNQKKTKKKQATSVLSRVPSLVLSKSLEKKIKRVLTKTKLFTLLFTVTGLLSTCASTWLIYETAQQLCIFELQSRSLKQLSDSAALLPIDWNLLLKRAIPRFCIFFCCHSDLSAFVFCGFAPPCGWTGTVGSNKTTMCFPARAGESNKTFPAVSHKTQHSHPNTHDTNTSLSSEIHYFNKQ